MSISERRASIHAACLLNQCPPYMYYSTVCLSVTRYEETLAMCAAVTRTDVWTLYFLRNLKNYCHESLQLDELPNAEIKTNFMDQKETTKLLQDQIYDSKSRIIR